MKLSDRELATVLAALRYWQADMIEAEEELETIPVVDAAGHFSRLTPLTPEVSCLVQKSVSGLMSSVGSTTTNDTVGASVVDFSMRSRNAPTADDRTVVTMLVGKPTKPSRRQSPFEARLACRQDQATLRVSGLEGHPRRGR